MQIHGFMETVYQMSKGVFIKVILKNSHPEVFCKKGVLKNFVKFTGNPCHWPGTLLKESLRHRYFLVKFAKFLRTAFI